MSQYSMLPPGERIAKLEAEMQGMTTWKKEAEVHLTATDSTVSALKTDFTDFKASFREQRAYILGGIGVFSFASGSGWFSLKNIAEWILHFTK